MTHTDTGSDLGLNAGAAVRPRPQLHFTATDGWINDPYGVHWDGAQYHLFYQALPGRVTWAPQCEWGHAVSADLLRWQEEPIALAPAEFEVGCWSGSAVEDDGELTLLYTRVSGLDWGKGEVAVARRPAGADQWHSTVADVLIEGSPPDLDVHSFRDPYVWRYGDGWKMLIGAGLADGSGAALQYSSTDLHEWTYDGVLASRSGSVTDEVWTGALWECPQFFEIDGEWALLVSVWDDNVLHHVAAAVGDYDGSKFVPRFWQQLTHGQSAYAMSAFLDKDGRRCVLSWLREEPQNNPALTGWAGMHSVTAVVSRGPGGRLVLSPHPVVLAALPESGPAAATDQAVPSLITVAAQQGAEYRYPDCGAGVRVTVDPLHGVRVSRPGRPPALIPVTTGAVTILSDTDVIEIFTDQGHGAYRGSPA